MSVTTSITSTALNIQEQSLGIDDANNERSTADFVVQDSTGLQHYQKGQQIMIVDSVQGNLFTGIVNDAEEEVLYPSTQINSTVACIDNTWFADKLTYTNDDSRNTNRVAGDIVTDLYQQYLAPEGIICPSAVRRDTTTADFNQGLLTNVVTTPNIGDGDLELGVSGTQILEEFYYQNEWNTQGAFSNTLADTSSPDSYLLLNQYFKDWNDGSTAGQGVYGTGIISAGVVGGGVYQITAAPNGGDVTSYLGSPGTWGDFTMECDCFIGATSINSLSWRTTSFNNNSGSYAYALRFYTTGISLWRGTNGGATGGVQLTAATFGTALAANAYYRVKVVMTGANMYLYVNGTFYLSYGDSTWAAAGYFGLRNWNQTNTSNRTVYFANFGVATSLAGAYASFLLSINSVATVSSSVIAWDQGQTTDPADVTINVYTTIDGGVSYQVCSNGGFIPGLGPGATGTGKNVGVYVTYSLANTKAIPRLRALAWGVAGGGYLPSGTRTTKTFDGKDTVHRVNVASGFGTSTDKNIWTQAGVGTTAVNANEAQISATTGNVLMQLGTNTLTDMEDYVRFQTSANGTYAGTLLRYVDANNWYAVFCTLNSITLYKMIAGVAYTLSTATPTLALSTWYRLRARITGTGAPENPAIISGKVWLDGSAEPSPWTLQFTDRLGQDTFTRANQAGWNPGSDGQNWTIKSGTMTLSISNNVGLITAHTAVAFDTIAYGTKTSINAELLCLIAASSTGDEIGVMCRQTAANTYYMAFLFAGTTLFIQKNVAGVVTTIASVAYSYTINTYHYIRFRVVGSTLSAKAWPANITEPAGFSVTATDTAITAAGQYGICTYAGNTADTCYYVTFYASDANILASGGYGLLGSGAGMAQFDNFIASPSPFLADVYGLDLTPVGRLGSSSVSWNDVLPPNTTAFFDISVNGGPWQDMTSNNDGAIPGVSGQPDPTIDGFDSNTSANYTNTFKAGGSIAMVAYDTPNSRITISNGSGGLYLYSAITQADIDLLCDMDISDAGGLVWRQVDTSNYYELGVYDDSSNSGFTNQLRLYKILAGVRSLLGVASAIAFPRNTPTLSPYKRIRVTMLAGVISVYFDGMLMQTYTDASPLTAGLCGLRNDGGTSRYYQLRIQPVGDDVTGIVVYSRVRLATTDATKTPQVLDLTISAHDADVANGALIPSTAWQYKKQLSQCIDDAAKQSNYWWGFPNKKFKFLPFSGTPAPWILTGNDILTETKPKVHNISDKYVNRVRVTNATDIRTDVQTRKGDNTTMSWAMPFPVQGPPSITVGGVTQTVGVKGIDTGKQWYWQFGNVSINQDNTNTALTTSQTAIFTYPGLVPYTAFAEDVVEQAAFQLLEGGTGIVEGLPLDGTGLNKAAADAKAINYLTRFKVRGRDLTFQTNRSGLLPGQLAQVFFSQHGIFDKAFLINRVRLSMKTKSDGVSQLIYYNVECSETPYLGSYIKLFDK